MANVTNVRLIGGNSIRVCDYGCVSLTSDCADCDKDQCKDGVLRKCNNRMLEAEGNACPTNQCADETKCSVECNAGDTRCSNGYIQVCNNNIFENSKACKNGCDAQNISCATTCTEGSTICIDGVLKKCTEGSLDEGTACPGNASCSDNSTCGICKDGEIKCVDDDNNIGSIYTCNAGQWEVSTACHNVSCNENKECGECLNTADDQYICQNKEIGSRQNIGVKFKCVNGKLNDSVNDDGEYESATVCTIPTYGYVSCNPEGTDCGECLHNVNFCFLGPQISVIYSCNNGEKGDYTACKKNCDPGFDTECPD